MKDTLLALLACLGVATCAACARHSDYFVEFRLLGTIKVASASARAPQGVAIQMLDTGMDDVRSKGRPAFLASQIQEGVPFNLTAKYFWGSENPKAFDQATFAVRVEVPGCATHEQEFRLAGLPEDGRVLVVDLKTLTVSCNGAAQ